MQTTIDQVVGDQTVDVVDVGDQRVYPKFENFLDVVRRRDELLEAVKRYPLKDVIYFFPHLRQMATTKVRGETYENRKKLPKEFLEGEWNWCIAGSSAVFQVQKYLNDAMNKMDRNVDIANFLRSLENEGIAGRGMITRGEYARLREMIRIVVKNENKAMYLLGELDKIGGGGRVYGDFRPSDTDIFFLNSVANHRYLMSGVDIVHTKAKTVEELLLNFDLPCCRAGFNSRSDFWVSAQCLVSLLYGRYYLPSFIQDRARFSGILSRYRSQMNHMDEYLHVRLLERIHKYKGYGFMVDYVDGDVVPEWIRNRFHYGEWKEERLCYECQVYLPFDKVQDEPCYLCLGSKCLKLHGGENVIKIDGKTFCVDCQALWGKKILEMVSCLNWDRDELSVLNREYDNFYERNNRFPSVEEVMDFKIFKIKMNIINPL